MDNKKGRKNLEIEFLGGIVGLLLIIFAAVGFLNMENASGFFVMVFGLGVLMNGCLAGLSFLRKKYILAAVLAVLAAALLVLFIIQLMTVEGLIG